MNDEERLAAEARARKRIDAQLTASGWAVQNRSALDLWASEGVAVREVTLKSGHGRADYLLYVGRKVVGVIEAKPAGTTLSGVEWQSAMYANGLPPEYHLASVTTSDGRLPFVFEASGVETHFTNGFDPDPRSRELFTFPRPETLAAMLREAKEHPEAPTWRGRVRSMPPLDTAALRPAQITAIGGIEKSLAEQRFDRSLVQMATGAGKTYTAVTECYRLLAHGGFKRILFLVDRNNLAKQTLAEFSNYVTPDDGRKFTEVYGVQRLKGGDMLDSAQVVISTIQRVFQAVRQENVSVEDDPQLDDYTPEQPVTVQYSAQMPPEAFDLVIVDEAHRSIYGSWRPLLEYFDAHIVGLTATPGKQTFAFFKQNLVSEYTYPESVADLVNVDFDVYRIKTQLGEEGGLLEAGTFVPKVDRLTRERRLEALDEDVVYTKKQLDRAVTSTSQIRLVLETYRDRLFTEIFPGRSEVPKTLIFAKDDNHAEEIVRTVREVFGKGNDFAAKITYSARDAETQIKALRHSPTLRVAVTVDMIATGTDVKPLECVFFMRDVASGQYFEQMKGRGARTIAPADFRAVTPDASEKTRFVIVDAVGVTEHPFVAPPLNRDKKVALKKLLEKVANNTFTEDDVATLASRLSKLELQLTPAERTELDAVAGGSLRSTVTSLVDAVDPDVQAEVMANAPDGDTAQALRDHLELAVRPIASNAELRGRILELRRQHDRIIDEVNVDTLLHAGGTAREETPRTLVDSWAEYLAEHRDEIAALQVLQQTKTLRVRYEDLQELANRIQRPPHSWTPEKLWQAYEQLDAARVKPNAHAKATDLVTLMRYTLGLDEKLSPFEEVIRERYTRWLAEQQLAGAAFTENERWWLDTMVDVVATSGDVELTVLEQEPFTKRGGAEGALRDLGNDAGEILDGLTKELTA